MYIVLFRVGLLLCIDIWRRLPPNRGSILRGGSASSLGAMQDRPAPGTSHGQPGQPQDADGGAQGDSGKPWFTCDGRCVCANRTDRAAGLGSTCGGLRAAWHAWRFVAYPFPLSVIPVWEGGSASLHGPFGWQAFVVRGA